MAVAGGDRGLGTYYADRPVVDPDHDAFGFLSYADEFALLINDQNTDTPLTVAISGPWGSGKTSLARLLESRLGVEEYWRLGWQEPPITSWFNAWMHADAPHLGAALAASVIRDVSRNRPWRWRLLSPLPSVMLSSEQRAWRWLWTCAAAASLLSIGYAVLIGLLPQLRPTSGALTSLPVHWQPLMLYSAVPAAIALFRNAFKVSAVVGDYIDAPRSAASLGTIREVSDQFGRIMRQAQGSGRRRIVIVVDDLERCPADKALDMCEVVSQLLGHEDLVTVLVADLDLLEQAAQARYQHAEAGPMTPQRSCDVGQEYLHKLIQLRFNLPPLDRAAIASSLGLADPPAGRADPR